VERWYANPVSFVLETFATRRRNVPRQTDLLPAKTHACVMVNNAIKIIVMKQKPGGVSTCPRVNKQMEMSRIQMIVNVVQAHVMRHPGCFVPIPYVLKGQSVAQHVVNMDKDVLTARAKRCLNAPTTMVKIKM